MSDYGARWTTVHPKFLAAVAETMAMDDDPHHPVDALAQVVAYTEAVERFVNALYDNGLEITERAE